jgi:hypothetical protein
LRSFELVLVKPHENIVSVYGICTDAPDGNLRLVMRLCVKSVWDLLQQHRARVSQPVVDRFTSLPYSFVTWNGYCPIVVPSPHLMT